jgi:hypothetical protein
MLPNTMIDQIDVLLRNNINIRIEREVGGYRASLGWYISLSTGDNTDTKLAHSKFYDDMSLVDAFNSAYDTFMRAANFGILPQLLSPDNYIDPKSYAAQPGDGDES